MPSNKTVKVGASIETAKEKRTQAGVLSVSEMPLPEVAILKEYEKIYPGITQRRQNPSRMCQTHGMERALCTSVGGGSVWCNRLLLRRACQSERKSGERCARYRRHSVTCLGDKRVVKEV